MAKKKFDYFQAFIDSAQYAVEYAQGLQAYLEKNIELQKEGREPLIEHAIEKFEELHEIEHNADEVKHNLLVALAVEFITPIEREDILELTEALDTIVDDLDEVLQRMYMYDVHCVTQECVDMARIVTKAVFAVSDAVKVLPNFKKKPKDLHEHLIQVDTYEEEGDHIYIQAMHKVYSEAKNGLSTIDAYGIGGLLSALEKCCDACESAAGAMTTVVMKNS